MSDSIIYEAQPIPPEDPKDRSRRQRTSILGAIALIVVLLAGVALGTTIFSGSDGDPLADDTTTTVTQPPTRDDSPNPTVPPTQNRSFGSEDSTSGYSIAPRPDRGEPTPPLPPIEFDWDRVELNLAGTGVNYLQQVIAVDNGFVALGMSFDDQEGTEQAVMLVSDDGLVWTQQDLDGDFANSNVWHLSFNENGGIAIGDSWETPTDGDEHFGEFSGTAVVWTTTDGSTWQRTEFPRNDGSNTFTYLSTGVAGPNGFVVFGTKEQAPDHPPIIIEQNGLSLELSSNSYTYRVLDAAGNVLASGSQDALYNFPEEQDGMGVWDPDTNDLIVVIPYEIWEQAFADAYERSGSGPFGQFAYTPVDVVIEHDGYRITVNEETTYTVENIATGEILVTSDADSLWQGPPPQITDADGNILMSFTWDEFHQAQEAYWNDRYEPFDYSRESVVYFSSDGVNWESRIVGNEAPESDIESVSLTERGYMAIGYSYTQYSEERLVLESTNGLDWTVVGGLDQYLWNLTQGPDRRLLAFGDGPNGQGLFASDGGANWVEVLPGRVPEDENTYEWFNSLASGDLGTVVVGNREYSLYETEHPEPLTITQNEYTLTFDDYDWPPRVTVVDNITGDTVIDVRLSGDEGLSALPEGFFYEDGVTIIENNDNVLLAITDEEFEAAQQARWTVNEPAYQPPTSTMYFSTDLDAWFEVSLDGVVEEGYINHVAVGPDSVVLTAEIYPEHEIELLEGGFDEAGSTLAVEDYSPRFVIYVGRPR